MTTSDEVVFREVIKDESNIEKKYTKLLTQCENYKTAAGKKLNFYIYASVNARDVKKGYFSLKRKLIGYEEEMINGVSHSNQLKRIDSFWISALMQPESRVKERRFMLDIDTKDEIIIDRILNDFPRIIICKRETVNGWHYVVAPFNKQIGTCFSVMEVKTDALLFLKHIKVMNDGNRI